MNKHSTRLTCNTFFLPISLLYFLTYLKRLLYELVFFSPIFSKAYSSHRCLMEPYFINTTFSSHLPISQILVFLAKETLKLSEMFVRIEFLLQNITLHVCNSTYKFYKVWNLKSCYFVSLSPVRGALCIEIYHILWVR